MYTCSYSIITTAAADVRPLKNRRFSNYNRINGFVFVNLRFFFFNLSLAQQKFNHFHLLNLRQSYLEIKVQLYKGTKFVTTKDI